MNRDYSVKSSAEFDAKMPGAQKFGNADQFALIKKLILKDDEDKQVGMVSVKRMHAGSKWTVIQLTVANEGAKPEETLIKIPGTHEVPDISTELCGFLLQKAGIQKASWGLLTESKNAEPVTIVVAITREKAGVTAAIEYLPGVRPEPDVDGGFKLVDIE